MPGNVESIPQSESGQKKPAGAGRSGGFLDSCPVPLVRLQFERMGGTVTPAAKLSFLSHKLSLDNPQFSGLFRIQ